MVLATGAPLVALKTQPGVKRGRSSFLFDPVLPLPITRLIPLRVDSMMKEHRLNISQSIVLMVFL
jgi:hypothetical protein